MGGNMVGGFGGIILETGGLGVTTKIGIEVVN